MNIQYDLLDAVIDKNLYNVKVNISDIATNDIPTNTFGTFVTVYRFRQDKMNSNSDRVHGCIGQWDNDFEAESIETILNKTLSVGHSAIHEDSRRERFSKDLILDTDAEFEITFMLKPLMKINLNGYIENSNKQFSNNEYGIIVQNKSSGSRATFLPKVFENEDWSFVSKSLMNKAKIKSDDTVEFYAYESKIIERTAKDRFDRHYLKFMLENYDEIPYSVENGTVLFKPSEYVRNSSTLCDLKTMIRKQYLTDERIVNKVNADIKKYVDKFVSGNAETKSKMRQSLAFLIKCIYNDKSYQKESKIIIEYLIANLPQIRESDPTFEYGEVIVGLAHVSQYPNIESVLKKETTHIKKIADNLISSTNKDKIFGLNWISQAIRALYDIDLFSDKDVVNKLALSVTEIVTGYDVKSVESNYLCVSLEALSALNKYSDKDLTKPITKLMKEIVSRYSNGLITFKSGDARIDITSHLLNSLTLLSDNKHLEQKGGLIKYQMNKTAYIELKKLLN